ncbi:unnamed protein product [Auanema sp. JU1783]|nr:unnamed protein product [Auanema sp. JU1783]
MGKHFEKEHTDTQSYVDKKFENMAKYKEWFYGINKNAEETLSVRSSRQVKGFKRLYLRCQTDSRRPVPLQSSRLEEKPTYVFCYCPAHLVVTECRQYVRVQGIIEHIHKEGLECEVIESVKEKNEENHRKCLIELEGMTLDELEEGQWQLGEEIINYNGNCQCSNKDTHCATCDCCSSNFSCSCSNMERVPCIHMHFLSIKIRNDKNKKQEESLLMVTRHKRTDNSQENVPLVKKADENNTRKTRKRKLKTRPLDVEAPKVAKTIDLKKERKSFRFRILDKPKKIVEPPEVEDQNPNTEDVASTTPVEHEPEKETIQKHVSTQEKTEKEIEDVEALFADLIHDTTTEPAPLAYLNSEDCALFGGEPVSSITPFMATELQQPLDISTEVLTNLSSLTEQPLVESKLEKSFSGF